MTSRRRMVIAALTAPPLGTALAFGAIVLLLDLGEELGPRGIARFFADFMVLGSAVAYLTGLVVGIPAYIALRHRRRLGLPGIVVVAALGGVLAFIPASIRFAGNPGAFGGALAVGAMSGAFAGAWFWLVAFGRRPPDAPDPA